jgi:hypothetical protein
MDTISSISSFSTSTISSISSISTMSSLSTINSTPDTIVAAVIKKFLDRAALGKAKYGVTLDRTDLKPLDWIQHAQEELMDGILYLEKLKTQLPN